SIEEINFEKDVLSFKEYHNMKFQHKSNDNDERLYFNGFDIIVDEALKVDEKGESYISNSSIDIINYENKMEQNILVPGYYVFKLINEKIKYAIIKIVPKEFAENEWQILYKSVNDYLTGIANSLSNKSNSKIIKKREDNNFYDKINFIDKYYIQINNSIHQLIANPRLSIQKNYNWVPRHVQPPIDKNTIKYASKYPNHKEYLYTYRRNLNFNIPENIWVKFVTEYLLKEINNIDIEIDNRLQCCNAKLKSKYTNEVKKAKISKENLEKSKNNINSIKNMMIKLKKTDWYTTVLYKRNIKPPYSSLMNKNYNLLYTWYVEFNKSNPGFIFSKQIVNSWKKTDELYEIWCYINIIEILRSSGFIPIKGWIFSGDLQKNLDEGTYVTMKKNGITLNIHYNSTLKSESTETDMINPLFTSSKKNKPDIRIDIFVEEIYLKSIPIEAKYRKLKSITNKSRGSLEQLLAYRDSPKSFLHLENAKEIRKNNHTVITKVIILYPKDISSKTKAQSLSFDYGLLFYEFGPNYIDPRLQEKLNDEINEAFEIYNDIY
ncbi:TPA: DUF2357 domain-containing protein, partial [Staphylococcus pseudintermedius]|nr:DUF2357 domain-containing protein [Staphylococcus pseudintermedius]